MIYVYLLVVAAVLAFGTYAGNRWSAGKVAKAEAVALQWKDYAQKETEAREVEAVRSKVVNKYVGKIIKAEGETRGVIKQIPTEIACSNASGTTVLDGAWRLSHDSGVSLANGDTIQSFDTTGAVEGITPSQALTTVVENYATCRRNSEKLSALIEVVTAKPEKKKAP